MGAEIPSVSHEALAGQTLRAGPIELKLEDGEIRYLRVGDKEIVRRVYFAVRDEKWATAMPRYTRCEVEPAADHFTVHLAAECKMGKVDYAWSGVITGNANGSLTFAATGVANADFESNRIGLCMLLGTPSLAGQKFETDGKPPAGEFPKLVSATHVADQFKRIEYTTDKNLHVACSVTGATFDMEDQRNWGDSSWKAFAPLPYQYTHVAAGDRKEEVITITVSGAVDARATPQDPVRLRIGEAFPGVKLPRIIDDARTDVVTFTEISFHRDQYTGPKQRWSYSPISHLPDADTILENLPALRDQALTVHGFNPNCTMAIAPMLLPGAQADRPLAAAWTVGAQKYLALGHVEESGFGPTIGALQAAAIDALRPYEGRAMLDLKTWPPEPTRLVCFAAEGEKGVALFVINREETPTHVHIEDLGASKVHVLHVGSKEGEQDGLLDTGVLKLELKPWEVCRVTVDRK